MGLRLIDRIFRDKKIVRKWLALELLEVCSKNGTAGFHYTLANRGFMVGYMKVLKHRRMKAKKKPSVKIETKKQKAARHLAEQKALYLLQLWADTFMMEQEKYPGFHANYRQLRKEGVQFPARDPNERLMMEGIATVESPMFDFVEQSNGVVRPEAPKPKPEPDFVEEEQEFEDQTDYSVYLRDDYPKGEFEVAKQTMMILEDMQRNANAIKDLQTGVTRDVYNEC